MKDEQERAQAHSSGRIMASRWVLTWKPIPEGERQEALKKRTSEGEHTTISQKGNRKAKTRLVIIGFQHPDLGTPKLKTASPVLGQNTRQLLLAHAAWRGWRLGSCDASSAFLQSEATEEENELWTRGVPELALALGTQPGDVLRILKAAYGLSTAPRTFWKDFKTTTWELSRSMEIHAVGSFLLRRRGDLSDM